MAAQQVWQAQEDGLKQICGLLSEYQAPNSNQSYVLQQLQQCSQIPDFNNYLAFILCRAENQSVEVRQAAGLLLKNNLKAHYQSIAPPYQQYIKGELVSCLGASDRQLRSTVGTVISVIIQQGQEAQTWPEMLDAILRCLESNDYNQMEGALDALSKICEDVPEALDIAIPGISEKPIDIFLPRLLKFFSSPHVILRKLALSSVNRFIPYMPNALSSNIDNYLGGLFSLAQDTAPEIRKLVCNAFVQFVECKSRFLEPHIKNITEYMLQANQEKDEEVALESCEFWSAFCKAQLPPELLREFLPRLIGVLLTNMDYADDDEALLDAEVDGSLPDRDQDIKPRFQKSRVMEADGEDKDEDDEVTSSWTLRKCSAAGLDILSVTFRDEILPILMPLVQSKLSITSDSAWKERESAVLALGAIAEGCINGLLPHLAEIVKVLLPLLEDRFPLVRSITCWTLSRYSRWIVQGSILFDDVLMGLLRRILDNSKKVQEAACSAFATFEEDAAEDMLTPHLESILQHLMYAYGRYQQRNLRILYDAMGTLAYAIGYDLNEPKYMNVLMPPLISKWQQLSDSDKELFPLMECLNAIAQAVGPGFSQYGEAVFIRCVNLIRTYQIAKVDQARAGVAYDKDFIACSLDLLSGLAEGLGSGIESLVGRSDLRDLLLPCCSDESPDVRQSALALLGDLAQGCAVHLRPHVAEFLNVAAAQLSSEAKVHIPVANNACWAIGEIAVQAKQEAAPIVMTTLAVLVPLLSNIDAIPSKSMFENSSITLGRLAWACPELVAPHVEHFMQPWCRSLCMIRDDFRKEDAFRGLCSMVRLNPNGALNSLLPMFQAIGSWNEIRTAELRDEIRQVLHGYKQILNGEYWDKCISAIDPALKEKLASNYGI